MMPLRIAKMFPKDTIVMTITGAKIAEVAVTTFDACFPDSIVGFIPDHLLNRDFLYYLLVAIKSVLLRATVVTTHPNINYLQIGGNYIPLPPVKEQAAIAEHIEVGCSTHSGASQLTRNPNRHAHRLPQIADSRVRHRPAAAFGLSPVLRGGVAGITLPA